MMVSLLIVTIALALVDGAGTAVRRSSRKAETRNIQSIMRDAILAYRTDKEAWPGGDGSETSSVTLLLELQNNKQAAPLLKRLPRYAVQDDGSGGDRRLVDGFGTPMRYDEDGGAAGRNPIMTSLGPDPEDETDDIKMEINQPGRI
jgi:hypothetical protein